MSILDNILPSRVVRREVQNAVQQKENGFNNSTTWVNGDVDYHQLFYGQGNKVGRYDNFYDNVNRIVTGASKYPFYYAIDNEVQEAEEGTFAYYIKNPNDSYPQRKVAEQVYTELITHGHCDLFIWRTDGKNESRLFDKKYPEDNYRGFTLVSGYDTTKFSRKDWDNIVRITYGASQENVFMGYSPSQAAQSWRRMQDEMGLHMTAFARNAGMPIGQWVITAESPEQYVKIKEKLEKKVSGAKNNGKMLFSYQPSTSNEVQIKWVQFTSQDVQDYTSQLEFADKKITKDFGVPGTVKGTNDGENYATANVSKQGFVEWTLEPLVSTFKEQLEFNLRKRFDIKGDIKVDVEIPELADESLVKIQATASEVLLFDQKIAEGYTPESIVSAYDLPERFLLLEKANSTQNSANNVTGTKKQQTKHNHSSKVRNEFERQYQNALSKAERDRLEDGFRDILQEYASELYTNGSSSGLREDFEGKMVAHFGAEYQIIYGITLDDVSEALIDELDAIDLEVLTLTDDELVLAKTEYERRVKEFSQSFTEQLEKIEGDNVEVRLQSSEPHRKMVQVTESEHTRIVSELKGWTKAQEEFPVRIYKTWNTRVGACPICTELEDIQIDVTALFINNPSNEIYEVTGGNAHPNCRCYLTYKVVKE